MWETKAVQLLDLVLEETEGAEVSSSLLISILIGCRPHLILHFAHCTSQFLGTQEACYDGANVIRPAHGGGKVC